MKRKIVHIALTVHNYDEAIQFYTQKLDFILIEDTVLSPEKRWILIKPDKDSECSILLAKASNEEQKNSIGNQTGGRVFLFLETDNFQRVGVGEISAGLAGEALTGGLSTTLVVDGYYRVVLNSGRLIAYSVGSETIGDNIPGNIGALAGKIIDGSNGSKWNETGKMQA